MSAPPPDNKKIPPNFVSGDFEDLPTTVGRESTRLKIDGRRDRPHLIVLAGENTGQMFHVDQSETVIGRAADVTICLKDDGVSRRHARIVQAGGDLWIEDLKSANGTIVNGQRIERAVLRDGDKIQIVRR